VEPEKTPEKPKVDARRRGKRIIAAGFVTLATVFIGLSALEIIPQVFGWGVQPLPVAAGPRSPAPGPACAEGVAQLAAALDRGLAAASGMRTADEEAAVASFHASLSPEWDGEANVAASCSSGPPRGADAFAALLRLKLAEEHFVRKNVVEIAPLRRDIAAYLGR
jgi:hypothetical protein